MTPEDFLEEVWTDWTVWDGRTLPLPDAWQFKVTYMPATADDWRFAVRKAIEATERQWNPIKPEKVFDYSVGVLWKRLAELSPIDSRPLPPFVADYKKAAAAEAEAEE